MFHSTPTRADKTISPKGFSDEINTRRQSENEDQTDEMHNEVKYRQPSKNGAIK